MNWKSIWDKVVNFFNDNFWNIVTFVAVLIIGIVVVKIVLNLSRRMMNKSKIEKVTQGFIYHIIKFCLYLLLVLILLSCVGVALTGLLTALSALVLAIGMALQNLITNIANGIVIVSMRMFKKGDYIIVSGVEGSIEDINFLYTTLITPDNKRVTLPNSSILNNPVTNLGAFKQRRVDWTFSVAYESDVELVKKIILDVMKSDGRVLLEPKAPFCKLKVMDSSSLNFFANCWVDGEDYWDVFYYVMENVFNEFKRNGISVPYNQLEIRERKDEVVMPVAGEGLPERVEKQRVVKKHMIDLENADLLSSFYNYKEKRKEKKDLKKQQKLEKEQQKNVDSREDDGEQVAGEFSQDEDDRLVGFVDNDDKK